MLTIAISSQEKTREYVMNIATGKHRPSLDEPKLWFTSMDSLADVLNDDNLELLAVIRRHKPESTSQLATLTGQSHNTLMRQLNTLSHYGLVALFCESDHIQPFATADHLEILIL